MINGDGNFSAQFDRDHRDNWIKTGDKTPIDEYGFCDDDFTPIDPLDGYELLSDDGYDDPSGDVEAMDNPDHYLSQYKGWDIVLQDGEDTLF